jgi:2-polyprenyl-3-methyl-5-hydroxy-6-metoxy-1,4-benzoquinol methylase
MLPKPAGPPSDPKPRGTVDDPSEILASLIQAALDQRVWKPERAATEAKRKHLTGLSARNIRDYINRVRSRPIAEILVRKFAKLFGENEESWLARFPHFSIRSLLLDRDAVLADQARLQEGDQVDLISSRPFLEADDPDVADAVIRGLERGITYTYYFPGGAANPYGRGAADSYRRFRETRLPRQRLQRPPFLFGYSLSPDRFRFFSALHTVVRHRSQMPGLTRTYTYIEPARGSSGQAEQMWYLLPDSVWAEIARDIRGASNGIADADTDVKPLNPCLLGVGSDYIRWFQKNGNPAAYGELKTIMGHVAARSERSLIAEISRTRRPAGPMKFLDVGCGDGEITSAIAERLAQSSDLSVVAVDSAEPQTKLANAKLSKTRAFAAEVKQTTFESFKPAQKFDLVTAIHSFYVIDEAYVRRIYDLLSPGGIACIWMAMRKNNVVSAITDAVDAILRPGQRRNTAEDLHRYAKAAGLSSKLTTHRHVLDGLVDGKGKPTEAGRQIIDFCALTSLSTRSPASVAAAQALVDSLDDDGRHPLEDGLIVIQKHE